MDWLDYDSTKSLGLNDFNLPGKKNRWRTSQGPFLCWLRSRVIVLKLPQGENSIQLQCLLADLWFVVESYLFLQLRFSFLFQCICPWNVRFFRHVQKKTGADCSTLHTPQDWNRRTSTRITTLRVQKGQPNVLTVRAFPQTLSSWSAGHWNSREDLNRLWHLMVCWLISRDHSHPAFKPWA